MKTNKKTAKHEEPANPTTQMHEPSTATPPEPDEAEMQGNHEPEADTPDESSAPTAGQTDSGAAAAGSNDTSEDTAEKLPDQATGSDDPRILELIDEAEQRGYMRGRNESIEALMRRPGMMERMPEERDYEVSGGEPMILSRQRISIWER